MQFVWIVITILSIWLLVVTFFYWKLFSHYNNLIKNGSTDNLFTVLDTLMKQVNGAKKDIALLQETCDRMEREGRLHIQKIGLLRFNPFRDTGGDQSFILALVDGQDTGVVISGLYSRSGTRWYAKKVVKGNSVDHELSEEEKKALKEAGHITQKKTHS